ncbi:flagellar hook-length control protein FliK [Cohnella sp. AR92]|uniref:flagellar hook-length control protein FliK n=1 Tax=Cohnella sp. AR92 TaxID=648716 RepID=UPI000F8D24EC|nr:flagellar hook-length control protein FliK [Cohnella sp. AR92]RUS46371.1 flagellar hook-length control protein FliK [Cohnella sp. AR92]
MNMIVTNTAPVSAALTNQGGTGKSSGSGGFAGALVQAIGGQNQDNAAGNGLALPVGLAAFIGGLGTEGQQEDGDSLLAALNALVQQLADPASDEETDGKTQDALSELLAALQALLQDTTVPADLAGGNGETDGASTVEEGASAATGQPANLLLLLQLLQQASKSNNGKLDPNKLENVTDQLKQLLAAAGPASGIELDVESTADKQADPIRVGTSQAIGTAGVQQQASTQTIHQQSASEIRKPSVFKEPVLYWNLQQEATASSAESDSSVVNPVDDSSSSANNGSTTLAWTLQTQDLANRNTELSSSKPALPAQVPVQQFSQQVGNYLVRQFVLTNGNGFTEAKITLTPEHLGQVDVRISMQDGQLTAQFLTHSGTAKDLIENQMSMLRSALQSQGIQVERIEVVQQPQDASDSTSFLNDQDRGSGSEQNGNRARQHKDGAIEEPVNFEDELERTTLIREAGFGASINTTA